jgi:uncharacterized protein YjlB
MKTACETNDSKLKPNPTTPERIHYKAFSHEVLMAIPGRDSARVRITSRAGRALLIDMGT